LDYIIERPKNAPNLEVDIQGGKNYVAQKRAEDDEYRKQLQAKYEYERLNPPPPPPPETSSDDDDGDIGMVGALTTIAGAYAATRSSSNHSTNNHATTAAMTSILTQSQQSNPQQYAVQNQDQDYESPQSNTANSNSGGGNFDYDSSHTKCVTYGRHPTLNAYAQYKNTCPYSVSVTYCSVFKNGRDNCVNRIFGNFDLKPGGTNTAEGSDVSVKYIACKLPYRSIGSEVKVSGGNLSAPCQKNK
jgi:hypothetical protein